MKYSMSEESLIGIELEDGRKIGNTVKHNTSEQSLISTELEDGEENQKHSET